MNNMSSSPEHYTIKYNDDCYVMAIWCNHCTYGVNRWQVSATRKGHRWPAMSHTIKRHLRDVHQINLYAKKKSIPDPSPIPKPEEEK